MLLYRKLKKLTVRTIRVAIAILRVWMGSVIFFWSKELFVGALLKLNHVNIAERFGEQDHLLCYLKIALMVPPYFCNDDWWFCIHTVFNLYNTTTPHRTRKFQ